MFTNAPLSGVGASAVGGGGAPPDARFVTLALDATLTEERTLAGESGVVSITDGGAGGAVTVGVVADGITFAKIQNASAADKLVGRGNGAGAGDFQEISLGTNLSMSGTTLNAAGGGGSTPTGTGFRHVTSGVEDAAAKLVDTADINNDQVTYAKIQNVSVTDRLLGRDTAAAGDIEELTVGGGL